MCWGQRGSSLLSHTRSSGRYSNAPLQTCSSEKQQGQWPYVSARIGHSSPHSRHSARRSCAFSQPFEHSTHSALDMRCPLLQQSHAAPSVSGKSRPSMCAAPSQQSAHHRPLKRSSVTCAQQPSQRSGVCSLRSLATCASKHQSQRPPEMCASPSQRVSRQKKVCVAIVAVFGFYTTSSHKKVFNFFVFFVGLFLSLLCQTGEVLEQLVCGYCLVLFLLKPYTAPILIAAAPPDSLIL